MLKIQKNGRYSLNFYFDDRSVRELLSIFQDVDGGDPQSQWCKVLIDKTIFHKRRKRSVLKKAILIIGLGTGRLYTTDSDNIFLELHPEDLQYGIKLLEFCDKKGYFELPEFTQIKVLGCSRPLYIFFVRKDLSNG